jgi:hypothetical protein
MSRSQAIALGDPETIRMVWDRSDERERVSNPALIRLAIDFHHVEVAMWLLQEQPLWVDIGCLFARETRAFDVLSRLPKGSAELPTLDDVSRVVRNPAFDGAVADAVETKSTSWLAAALLAGGNPNQRATNGLGDVDTVLCDAAESGYEDGVRLLLQFGADPNEKGYDERNALAEGANYPGIVRLLLEKGANPNAGDAGSYYNPLACAAEAQNIESLRLMLAYGGDASRVAEDVSNVLHAALIHTNAECCRELLAHGADPCGRWRYEDETPMHVAAECADLYDGPELVEILDLLLESGASPLAKDRRGVTPGERVPHVMAGRATKKVREWFFWYEAV